MSRSFRRFLARHRRHPVISAARRRAESWLRGADNFDYDPVHNGELFLLQQAARHLQADGVLLDVGANAGEWSRLARQCFPKAAIHAFEPVQSTYEKLIRAVPDVHANPFGLGDEDRTMRFRMGNDDTRATMLDNPEVDDSREMLCQVRRGQAYCAEHGIARIDLLKIDTEGAEPLVLKGLDDLLRAGCVGLIQFEYGRANIVSRFLLADFYALLEPLGFAIGKLYPNYVAFQPYATTMEDFRGPNYVAVHEQHSALRTDLAG